MAIRVFLGTLAPISVMIMLLILGELSRRLGQVTKAKPIYRWFYVSAGLSMISVIVRLLNVGADSEVFEMEKHQELALLYVAPVSLGLMISLATAWRYWGWLIYASEFQDTGPRLY